MTRSIFLIFFSLLVFNAFEENTCFAQDYGIVSKKYKAPDFEIMSENGKLIHLSDLKGNVVLINFFSTTCGLCRAELPYIQKDIWEKYKGNSNFILLVVGIKNTNEDLTKYKEANNIILPILPDFERKIYLKYAKWGIPRNYIIDKNGMIVYSFVGFYENEFKNMIKFIDSQLK